MTEQSLRRSKRKIVHNAAVVALWTGLVVILACVVAFTGWAAVYTIVNGDVEVGDGVEHWWLSIFGVGVLGGLVALVGFVGSIATARL